MATDGGFLRSTAQISVITAVARILGFARWIILGITVGATYLGNTYQTANWVPNILFELAAGGVLAAVFVPTFVTELERGRERGQEVASSLANFFLLLSIPVVLGGILLGRPLMLALTAAVPDPDIRAQQVELGAWFLRFFLPQIPLYLLAMVMTGVLHAHDRFVAPAIAPAVSSLVVISTYVGFYLMGPHVEIGTASQAQLWLLAGGTTAGVAALAFTQLPSVARLGFRWMPVIRLRDPSVRRAIRAGAYGMAFFGVTQIGLIATLVLGNRVRGGVVAYQIAYAFFELPNALIGLPIAIALFPTLARQAARHSDSEFARLLSSGWRSGGMLLAPAAAGLFVLAHPLARTFLEGGVPARAAPTLTGTALGALALGVPAYALSQTVIRSFYARHQTRPPVLLNAVAIGTFVALATVLTVVLQPVNEAALQVIGGSFAVGQWAGLAVGITVLARRTPGWGVARDLAFLSGTGARAVAMALAVWLVAEAAAAWGPIGSVTAGVATGVAVYTLLSIRTPELRHAVKAVRRR